MNTIYLHLYSFSNFFLSRSFRFHFRTFCFRILDLSYSFSLCFFLFSFFLRYFLYSLRFSFCPCVFFFRLFFFFFLFLSVFLYPFHSLFVYFLLLWRQTPFWSLTTTSFRALCFKNSHECIRSVSYDVAMNVADSASCRQSVLFAVLLTRCRTSCLHWCPPDVVTACLAPRYYVRYDSVHKCAACALTRCT